MLLAPVNICRCARRPGQKQNDCSRSTRAGWYTQNIAHVITFKPVSLLSRLDILNPLPQNNLIPIVALVITEVRGWARLAWKNGRRIILPAGTEAFYVWSARQEISLQRWARAALCRLLLST